MILTQTKKSLKSFDEKREYLTKNRIAEFISVKVCVSFFECMEIFLIFLDGVLPPFGLSTVLSDTVKIFTNLKGPIIVQSLVMQLSRGFT